MLKRLVLFLGSSLLALALLELALRLFDLPRTPPPPTFVTREGRALGLLPDPSCFWRLSPSVTQWQVNSIGLRGWLPTAAPRASTYRIACAGDSCSFGIGVTYEQVYGIRVERALQDIVRGGCIETVLAALPAFSSQQTLALYATDIAPLRPDLTIVYCGAWNDYQPMLDSTDRSIFTRLSGHTRSHAGLRLLRLLTSLRSDAGVANPYGVRVPLVHFDENLRDMISIARANNSTVIIVVPPVRADTERATPICRSYQDAVRRVAHDLHLPLVDGPELFARVSEQLGTTWTTLPANGSPLFVDGAHPSAFGHSLLARAIERVIHDCADAKLRLLLSSSSLTPRDVAVDSVLPESVPALHSCQVTLFGHGFRRPHAFSRVLLGNDVAPSFDILDDSTVRIVLPETLCAGGRPITLLTDDGPIRSSTTLLIEPPPIAGRIVQADNRFSLLVTLQGKAHREVGFWLAKHDRTPPLLTTYGPFSLAHTSPLFPTGFEEFPPKFPPFAAYGTTDANGLWTKAITLPSGEADEWIVQGIIMKTGPDDQAAQGPLGTMTNTVRVRAPH